MSFDLPETLDILERTHPWWTPSSAAAAHPGMPSTKAPTPGARSTWWAHSRCLANVEGPSAPTKNEPKPQRDSGATVVEQASGESQAPVAVPANCFATRYGHLRIRIQSPTTQLGLVE